MFLRCSYFFVNLNVLINMVLTQKNKCSIVYKYYSIIVSYHIFIIVS